MRAASIALVLACAAPLRPQAQLDTTTPPQRWLAQLPAELDTVVWIGDGMPLLSRVLRSKVLQRELASGPAAEMLQQAGVKVATLRAALGVGLKAYSQEIPSEAALACNAAALRVVGDLLRAAYAVDLIGAAQETDPDAGERAVQALRRDLLQGFRVLTKARVVVWARARHERAADRWLDALGNAIDDALADADLDITVEREEARIAVQLPIGEWVEDRAALAEALEAAGLSRGAEDPFVAEAAEALRGAVVQLRVERHDTGLWACFGAPLPPLPPRGGREPDGGSVLFARWSAIALTDSVAALRRVVARWSDTIAGRQAAAENQEELHDAIRELLEQRTGLAASGSLHVKASASGLEFALLEQTTEPGVRVRDHAVGRLLPAAAELVSYDGVQQPFAAILPALRRARDRLEARKAEGPVGEATAARCAALERFIAGLAAQAPKLCAPSAALVTSDGRLELRHGDAVVDELHVPAIAWATGLVQPEQWLEPARDLLALCAEVASGDPTLVRKAEPRGDLGVPAVWLPAQALPEPLRAALAHCGKDFRLHAFAHDGALVLSTSRRLSQRLLAAPSGAHPAGDRVRWLEANGTDLAALWSLACEAIAEQIDAAAIRSQSSPEPSRRGVELTTRGGAALLRLLGTLRVHGAGGTGTRITGSWTLEAAPEPDPGEIAAALRTTLGVPEHGGPTLEARGQGRIYGEDCGFRLVVAADGRVRLEITDPRETTVSVAGLANGWHRDARSTQGTALGQAERLRAFGLAATGAWLSKDARCTVQSARTAVGSGATVLRVALPQPPFAITVTAAGEPRVPARVDLSDPAPMARAREAWCLASDYRQVGPRLLPHFVAYCAPGVRNEYRIAAWREIVDDTEFERQAHPIAASEVKASDGPAELPLVVIKQHHVLVQPRLSGKEVGWLVLCPENDVSILAPDVADQLRVAPGPLPAGTPVVASVQLGAVTVSGERFQPGPIGEEWSDAEHRVVGLLSGAPFHRCVVELDLGRGRLRAGLPGAWDRLEAPWQPLRFSYLRPLAEVQVGADPVTMLLNLNRDHVALAPWLVTRLDLERQGKPTGPWTRVALPATRIGEHRLEEPRAFELALLERPWLPMWTPAELGLLTLGPVRILLDYPRERFAILPREG